MKQKNITYFILLFIICTSCKKSFLDVNTQKEPTLQGYVKDLNTLEHYFNGIYRTLGGFYESGIGAAYPELVADNLKTNNSKVLIPAYTWSQQTTESMGLVMDEGSVNATGLWSGAGYYLIRACDFVLEEISKYRSENPSKADLIKGESLALRAMIHFRILNIFAQPYNYTSDASHDGIPYITSSDITLGYARETVKAVYEKVIADFEEAITLLPEQASDIRRINRTAVKGLLARVYLFKEDYAKAKQQAEEVISLFPIMSVPQGYPNAIFKNLPASQTESLFQIRPIDVTLFLNIYLRYEEATYFEATKDIADILTENPNDIRQNWISKSGNRFLVRKFPTGVAIENPAINFEECAYYPSVIRTSELVLTASEAAAKLNEEDVARKYLNEIRRRSDNTASPIIASGAELMDSIYKERRKELCFEGWRLYDLQRWKAGIHRKDVDPNYQHAKDLNFPSDKAIAPIPIQEIRYAGLKPNPGY